MEKQWFPQQRTIDAPIALLKNFIFNIGFPISRSTIETDTKAHKEFPFLSIGALGEILDKWGIKTLAFNCEIKDLSDLPIPSVTFIHETIGNDKLGNFILFFGVNDGVINYLHTRKGWVLEPIEEFEKKWAKAVLVITEIVSEGESDLEEKEKAYIQTKNSNPDLKHVIIKDDFLTDEECNYVINLSMSMLKRSTLMAETNIVDYGRTSYSAEFHVLPTDPILNGIRKKAAELIKMPENHFEFFQSVAYDPNQEYQNHYDTFDENSEHGRKTIEESGQRKYTLLAYLNDNFEGGGTHFPNLDILVQPKKGRVVIFNNLDNDGMVLKAAYHAGLPVTKGRKYAINIWVHTKPVRN